MKKIRLVRYVLSNVLAKDASMDEQIALLENGNIRVELLSRVGDLTIVVEKRHLSNVFKIERILVEKLCAVDCSLSSKIPF